MSEQLEGGSAKSPFGEITFPPKINNKKGGNECMCICMCSSVVSDKRIIFRVHESERVSEQPSDIIIIHCQVPVTSIEDIDSDYIYPTRQK